MRHCFVFNMCHLPIKPPNALTIVSHLKANQFIRLGAQDPVDPSNVIPVVAFMAEPSTTSYITPQNQYYISWGPYVAGQIIDIAAIPEPVKIDFTGKASNAAKVENRLDGTWDVTFN